MYNGVYNERQFAYMYQTVVKWLKGNIKGETIADRLSGMGCKNVAIYGMGELGEMLFEELSKSGIAVEALIDRNRSAKIPGDKKTKLITPGEASILTDECYVIVTPEYYYNDILDTLTKQGIPENRILTISMLV